jgi:ribosomal protein L11 methyltransferase
VAEDWAERWKAFHAPLLVEVEPAAPGAPASAAPALWVRPPWATPRADALDLVIDPGQAFGTGSHPTTRLCLELLLGLAAGGAPAEGGAPADSGAPAGSGAPAESGAAEHGAFADLGCGSGVLAIAAAKLGFAPVTAVDNELAALDATRANAAANGVTLDRVERVNLREEASPAARTVAANLVGTLLLQLADRIEGERLILSGLLEQEADEVAAAFGRPEARRLTEGGWAALLLM